MKKGIVIFLVLIMVFALNYCVSRPDSSPETSTVSQGVDKEPCKIETEPGMKETGDEGGVSQAPAAEGPADVLFLEAEDASALSGAVVDTKNAGFTGLGFVDYQPNAPGGYIEWEIQVPQTREYTLVFTYALNSGNRPAEISVNGIVVAAELGFPATGDWEAWSETSVNAPLQAGQNRLRVTATGPNGGANIDSVKLIPVRQTFSRLFEAEDAVALSGAVVDTKNAGFSGLGFVDYQPNAPGGYIEWEIEVPESGEYALIFTYALNSGNRPAEIRVNGVVVAAELGFAATGDWEAWSETSVNAQLQAGQNRLRATATGPNGGANIDSVKVVSGGAGPGRIFLPIDVVDLAEIFDQAMLTKLEKKGLLVADAANAGTPPATAQATVGIAQVDAVGEDIVLVTLDSAFDNIDMTDIMISAAKGNWNALDPKLTPVKVNRGAVTKNASGSTVLVYELAQSLAKAAQPERNEGFTGDLAAAKALADIYVSWQMDHGGWAKSMNEQYKRLWDGKEPRSVQSSSNGVTELGSIDNGATITQINRIALAYAETGIDRYKASIERGIDFLLTMQYPSGGFPQVYPKQDVPGEDYANYATYNDNAMVSVLNTFESMLKKRYPFTGDLISDAYHAKIQKSLAKGVDFIIKSQIVVDGKPTAWCAQHDPVTYKPVSARVYEHPTISGSESVALVRFLMTIQDPPAALQNAINSALQWFDEVKVEGITYVRHDPDKQFFIKDPKGVTWYRFYEIGTNKPVFSGRDGVVKYDLREIEEERQYGYTWAGSFAARILEVAGSTGYFEGQSYAQVVKADSRSIDGKSLRAGDLVKVMQ